MAYDSSMAQISQLQDVQLMNALSDLKNNPAKLNDYISAQKSDLYSRISAEHSDTFQKVFGDATRASNTANNILYYYVRNKDLDLLQQSVLSKSKNDVDAATYDAQTAKRQFEINEWTVGNKQDTLFFLQLTLISFAFLAVLLYLRRIGFVPTAVFTGVSSLLGIAMILTLIVRVQYTNKTRDNKFWNRRRFERMGGPPAAPNCEAISGMVNDAVQYTESVGQKAQSLGESALGRITAIGQAAAGTA